ncbi:membrane protein insertase YidC [Buchnera aphidicola (Thelaxes californica)]|uniref:Membrane protein insertase YidC n=1 Tax=Buchnera aphidicola (Thelaxes californica) TaxID=1315998 RepID=A0A4D6YEV0_9GAMM|nr:membrane protein insertase YidC [Buchnera aphidicola]QCI26573.1 membrane protein insertase YidC [Buchnera aphidicola (Thelaxes californica)]
MKLSRNFFIFSFLIILIFVFPLYKKTKNIFHTMVLHQEKNTENKNVETFLNPKDFITIKNNVIQLYISKKGGDVVRVELLKFKDKLHSNKNLKLLDITHDFIYQANSGLIGINGIDDFKNNQRPLYTILPMKDQLFQNQQTIIVPMKFVSDSGVTYIKTFTLKKNAYFINVEYKIINNTNQSLNLSTFNQLKQSINSTNPKKIQKKNLALRAFRGTAYSTDQYKYKKYDFEEIKKNNNIQICTKTGWIAMLQQYFISAWIPKTQYQQYINTKYLGNNIASISFQSEPIIINAKDTVILNSVLWLGPEQQDTMETIAPYLNMTVDYGFLWFLSQPLFKVLQTINFFLGNWGCSIIAITFIMKLAMYPISKIQYRSMYRIKQLQPKIHSIKKKYAHDQQKITEKIIHLYKKENINPLSGLLPILIQMPLFLALYYMLMNSVELRHAPFFLWIEDLSDKDPFYFLPICLAVTMLFTQNNTSDNFGSSTDKKEKFIQYLPLMFIFLFLWFPSGLVLYYIVNNLISIVQQKIIFNNLKNNP